MRFLRLNPKRTAASRWASFRRNAVRVLAPFVIASLMTAIWSFCRAHGWYLPKDADMMLSTAVLVLAAIFAIAAAMVLNGTWERSRKIACYVLTNDKKAFMEVRDEKLPIAMHLVLAALALSVLALLGAADYPTQASGTIIVFSAWFTILLYFVVVIELQDPTTSVWFQARIPQDWLDEKVDTYFKLHVVEH
jgi:hypothetical protein